MASAIPRTFAPKKPTTNHFGHPAPVTWSASSFRTLGTSRVSSLALNFVVTRSHAPRAGPRSVAPNEELTVSPQSAISDMDLDQAALRVRQLEAEAIAMHDLAQRLNKEGCFEEAQAAYAAMHRLEDEASELAARVGCVACVLGEEGQEQPSLCTLDPALLVPYQRLHPVLPWLDRRSEPQVDVKTPLHQPLPQQPYSQPRSELLAFRASVLGARALGCVLGSALADAAAMGVHWVYDLALMDEIEKERRHLVATSASPSQSSECLSSSSCYGEHPFAYGLEFTDPPRSPFYSYTSGRNSPYGEQTLVLLRSLAEGAGGGDGVGATDGGIAMAAAPGLHCGHYASLFAQTFGPESGFNGYRDVSTKGFLRNFGRGIPPPLSGANDAQANCVARLAPLAAAFAAPALAYPSACPPDEEPQSNVSFVSSGIPLATASGAAAEVAPRSSDLFLHCVELATRVTQNTDAAVAWASAGAVVLEQLLLGSSAVAAVQHVIQDLESPQGRLVPFVRNLGPEIAGHLVRVLELRTTAVPVAVAALGRNCHMPNALQTPLHVVLHVEHMIRQRDAFTSVLDSTNYASHQGATAVTTGAMVNTEQETRYGGPGVAGLPYKTYVWAVRLAVREGGCCASRAAFVGACVGAMVAGLNPDESPSLGLPEDWLGRYPFAEKVRAWADMIVEARRQAS
ncbi:hypothetical protein VaNZ11_013830 [Volvox africanus]|uniref:Uncharacterized protein n=1 Tax=Volvox africanus TaxID=51714 RepID=A0ABQ5SH19_9CHLO|nr:hypothetical protein VaNZ11_013830 [Volvox africanus]